jgi:hypothetical protein
MIHHFKCTLLSRVVLPARPATEGQVDSLDYIPGAKFMGIVARGYDDLATEAQHDLFHNGKVRFSNAYPYVAKTTATTAERHFVPAPLVYFSPKGGKPTEADIYLDHLLAPDTRKSFSKHGIQLKQVRKGFVDTAGEQYAEIKTDYQLKSAHDAAKRRSKDSQMYGYFSIPKGTTFAFSVDDTKTKGKYTDVLHEALSGEHGIGRSRTAEYGRVRIEKLEPATTSERLASGPVSLIYAVSDLCFYDEFGQAKRPEASDLGFPGAAIDWAGTQVQSKLYQSWNGHRWNRDADRWVITKGSVFRLKEPAQGDVDRTGWVGSHHQEGFGQIWENPPFLQANEGDDKRNKLTEASLQSENTAGDTSIPGGDNGLLALLRRRATTSSTEGNIYLEVNKFIKNNKSNFGGITASQWGTLRNYASNAGNADTLKKLVFDKDFGFLYRGQSDKKWGGVREKLQTEVEQLDPENQPIFLQKLAAQMAKESNKNQSA